MSLLGKAAAFSRVEATTAERYELIADGEGEPVGFAGWSDSRGCPGRARAGGPSSALVCWAHRQPGVL